MPQLNAQIREIFGKKVKNLLKQGFIPAELYGPGVENLHLMVPAKEFYSVFEEAGESSLVDLKVEGKTYQVIIHEISKDLLGKEVIHIDFYQVRMDRKVTSHIPLHFEGVSPAVKEKGGILVKAVERLEVEALPSQIPSHLTVDLSLLDEIHKSIHLKDISIPEGVRVLADPETVLATVVERRVEEEKEKEEAETPEEEKEKPASSSETEKKEEKKETS